MKTSALLITVVVMLHCVALGALFVIQGCGTTARTGTPPPATPPMPPTTKEAVKYPPPRTAEAPAAKPVSKELPKAVETTEYVVRSGDSISAIAKQYGVSQGAIVELNKLSDPNKLRVGQKLMLPGRLKIKAAPAAPAKHPAKAKTISPPVAPAAPAASAAPWGTATEEVVSASVSAAGQEYVVQKGDSLYKIAKKYGVKIGALREANKMQGDKLKIGQKLVIPEAAAAPAVSADTPAASAAPMIIPAPAESAPAPISVASSGITHIVQPDEDINSIAKLYAVTVDEIVELNQLGVNRAVNLGQRLKIP